MLDLLLLSKMNKEMRNILFMKIYDRLCMLINGGKTLKEQWNNHDLSKIFETYTCLQLSNSDGKIYYEYEDIDADFKEDNQLSKQDTGIDFCDKIDTIGQCKLYNNSISWNELGTFFGSQNIYKDGKTIVRWDNMIVTRINNSTYSHNMKNRMKMFRDIEYNRNEFLDFCENVLKNPPKMEVKINKKETRYYQQDCKDLILNTKRNIIVSIPTGSGKNYICVLTLLKNKNYLILVPRQILLYQIRDDIISEYPYYKNNIQLLGDGNNIFNSKKNITICVYNSIDKITEFNFEKIFIDEAHHVLHPYFIKWDTCI